MEFLLVTAMVVGVVELIRRIANKEWFAVITIISAALVGAIAGFFSVEGLDIVTGIVVGLAGSGLVTVAGKVGELTSKE